MSQTILPTAFPSKQLMNALYNTKESISLLALSTRNPTCQFTDCRLLKVFNHSSVTKSVYLEELDVNGEKQARNIFIKDIYWILIDNCVYINTNTSVKYAHILDLYNKWRTKDGVPSSKRFFDHLRSGGYAALNYGTPTFVKSAHNSDIKVIDVLSGQKILLTLDAVKEAELIAAGSSMHLSLVAHETSVKELRNSAQKMCLSHKARVFNQLYAESNSFARSPSTGELFWNREMTIYNAVFDMTTAPTKVIDVEEIPDDIEIVADKNMKELIEKIVAFKETLICQ
jgi:hypothetical protein